MCHFSLIAVNIVSLFLVFSSLILVVWAWISLASSCLRFTKLLESVCLCLSPNLGSLGPLFLQTLFQLILSFLPFYIVSLSYLYCCCSSSFKIYFLLVVQIGRFLTSVDWASILLTLCHLHAVFLSLVIFFSSKISIWFFFICSISLIRLSIFPFILRVLGLTSWSILKTFDAVKCI